MPARGTGGGRDDGSSGMHLAGGASGAAGEPTSDRGGAVSSGGAGEPAICVEERCAREVWIAAGEYQTCASLPDGKLRCWGSAPDVLQASLDAPAATAAAIDVGKVAQLSIGGVACALHEDGRVECWKGLASTRQIIELGGTVRELASGREHTCALMSGGTVRCWPNSAPNMVATVELLDTVTTIAAGWYHTCGALAGGGVLCWRQETPGALEIVHVGGSVTRLVAGYQHTCALLEGGAVRCWGDPASSGYAEGTQQQTPELSGDVDVGDSVTQLVTGLEHTCALLSDGSVRCWGNNATSRILGYAGNTARGTPAMNGNVDIGASVSALAAGIEHTCALLADQRIRCWGYSYKGQLGYGSSIGADVETPAQAGDVPYL